MKNYYAILEISENADSQEIKRAYRRLAKKYHPDAVRDDAVKMQKMYEIQEAYGCLGEEEKEDVMMREGKGNPHQMSEMLRMEPKKQFPDHQDNERILHFLIKVSLSSFLVFSRGKEWKRINIRKTECKETRNRYARRSYLVGFSGEWMGNEEGKRDEKEPLDKDWCRHGNPAV